MTVDDEEYFENLFKLVEVRKNGCTLEILVVVLVVCCWQVLPCPCLQHYQHEADGLCSRLKYSVDKTKDIEYVVNMQDFKDSKFSPGSV